jgi:hypothetical protein
VLVSRSFLFLDEGVRDLFASVYGRDDDQESAARDNEAELAIADVAVVVYTKLVRSICGRCSDAYQSGLL